jgi:hypothetical protein
VNSLSLEEIVKIELERTSPEKNWEEVYQLIKALPEDRVVRVNNSLFIFTDRGNKTASFAMCNADDILVMHKSLKEFFTLMEQSGFNKLLCSTKRKAMLRMVTKAGYMYKINSVSPNEGISGEVYLNV